MTSSSHVSPSEDSFVEGLLLSAMRVLGIIKFPFTWQPLFRLLKCYLVESGAYIPVTPALGSGGRGVDDQGLQWT